MNDKKNKKINDIEDSLEDRYKIRKLEQFYVDGTIDDLDANIEIEKEKVVKEMIEYAKNNLEEVKWGKDNEVLKEVVTINPKVVSYKFFKPIIKLTGVEPIYNAEKLGMVYDYYNFLVSEVNDKIGDFPSSLKTFCKFAGITTTSLRRYKNSEDPAMRVVVEKIYDEIEEDNVSMAQMGLMREKTTQFKLQTQNEIVVKSTPNVNINITEKPDLKAINEKLNKYLNFVDEKKE